MSFISEKYDRDNCVVIMLKGRILEAESIQQVVDTVRNDIENGTRCFIMDMGGIEILNSIGIGMLVRTVKAVNETGGKVIFTSVPPKIHELLQIIKLNSVMDIAQSIEEAAETLSKTAQ